MKSSEAKKVGSHILQMMALLVALPVVAQNAPPPLPTTRPATPRAFKAVSPARPNAPVSPVVAAVPSPVAPATPVVQAQIPAAVAPPAALPPSFTPADPNALKWDADTKEYSAKTGEAEAKFVFWFTNVSSSEVMINSLRTSCGCTVAKLPSQPWHVPPGSNGPVDVTVNLAGKSGLIAKGVTVETSVGVKQLTVRCNIPNTAPGALPVMASGTMADTDRLKNMQQALADRQVVFKNPECAKCHSEPAKGKTDGRLVYAAVCSTCHNSHLRAAMVPDLRTLPHPTDADHWRKWITYGRAGSMMPAFAEAEGGPLNQQQIDSLVDFMVKAFPSRPAPAVGSPTPAAQSPSALNGVGTPKIQ